uniref:glutamic acid-rich protein-like n=1 Tax=Osmia lignaria TaxID=473952 RepID=UPI0014782390|nr:glutamic acid-rich protein-like [Osmia lignaria]
MSDQEANLTEPGEWTIRVASWDMWNTQHFLDHPEIVLSLEESISDHKPRKVRKDKMDCTPANSDMTENTEPNINQGNTKSALEINSEKAQEIEGQEEEEAKEKVEEEEGEEKAEEEEAEKVEEEEEENGEDMEKIIQP